MATHKKESFGAGEQRLADWTKALGHPARIAILEILAKRSSCICGEIVEVLPLAQATVSQHLKALLEAGLIQGTVDGPRSCYCINPKALAQFEKAMSQFFKRTQVATPEKSSCC